MLCEAKRQSIIRGTKKSIGFGFYRNALRCGRLCWYGHVQHMDLGTWPKKVDETIVTGNNPRGRSRKTLL